MTGDTFAFKTTKSTVKGRIDAFIAWASPGGTGGFNRAHSDRYVAAAPWFEYSAALMPHSHETQRSWFIKQEHLNRSRLFTKARSHELPEVTVPDAMIKDGRFLRFAKAYVNIYCAIRGLRSAPKSAVRALIYLEKALRDLNDGDNDPSAICHQAVHRAALTAQRCIKSASKRFDIGKALEHISLLVQTGGRFKGDKKHGAFPGFCLLETNFSFRSPIKSPPRFGKKRSPSGDGSRRDADPANLTSEEVAAVGMAYRRARDHFGSESSAAFFAALVGLTLTTASMRASELQSLRVDALYQDKDASKRWRLRIPRPKIGIEQDLPIPRRLSEIARELFELVKQQTAEARAAFAFYIAQSPDTPADIRTLFIPDRLKPLFASHYFTSEQVTAILASPASPTHFPQMLSKLPRQFFVHEPGDLYSSRGNTAHPLVRIVEIEQLCRKLGATLTLPKDAQPFQFVSRNIALRWITGSAAKWNKLLSPLFESSKAARCNVYVSRQSLCAVQLELFKRTRFPHWPFTSKDRSVRLDESLVVCQHAAYLHHDLMPGTSPRAWWLPRLLSIQTLYQWISAGGKNGGSRAPLLFQLTNVRLSDGSHPGISIHRTRKYHHTSALLAGASAPFIDELAGRDSGWQSEHYDCRTPREILLHSMDTFDPDVDFQVIGPIADRAPAPSKLVERRTFLMENATPKHVTEIGGCRTAWSVNPCQQHGDCIRCDGHLWRKGDEGRLPRIRDIREASLRSIAVGRRTLRRNPRLTAVQKQVRQLQETVDRCDEILRIETEEAIAEGTIVTFAAAPSAMTNAQLISRLHGDASA